MSNRETVPSSYKAVLSDIIQKVQSARYSMLKTVNIETVQLYWQIGKVVSEKTLAEKWGNSVVEKLSNDLRIEFPGVKGFSIRNIPYMKSFYETYEANLKLQPLVAEIGWVQNCIIIEKCKDPLEREFYVRQIKTKGWSKNDLREKIDSHYYENQLLAQNNFEDTVSDELKARVAWEFVDDYNVELKAREFSPKDIGQLQMYLLAVNETVKQPVHSNTIGILVCRDKDRMVVEYLLNTQTQPMGVATYNKYHHLAEIPREIAQYLPSEGEIIKRLNFSSNIPERV